MVPACAPGLLKRSQTSLSSGSPPKSLYSTSPNSKPVVPTLTVKLSIAGFVLKPNELILIGGFAVPLAIVAVNDVITPAVAFATLLNDAPDKRITKRRIIGFFEFNILFMKNPVSEYAVCSLVAY
jgi:hypothetical protein